MHQLVIPLLIVGKYEIYQIKNIDNNQITVDKDIDTNIFTNDNCQVVKIANYKKVIINENCIVKPSIYDGKSGGIIAIDANEIILNGKLDASKCGYDISNVAPNNGTVQSSGNASKSGGSNKYKGGNGGKNYQGFTALAPNPTGLNNNILSNKQMTFGGGSTSTKGGGIVYIIADKLQIGSEYAIGANGAGGTGGTASTNGMAGGGAGGTIVLNSKDILFSTENKNYFAGANGGSGASEGRTGSSSYEYPKYTGTDGNNIKGADAPNSNSGKTGGKGYMSNGRWWCTIWY